VANLRRYAQAFGLDPKRLVFAPRIAPDDHLARHAFADLVLDTLPYNAHTTASDALWVGVPLITCPGESFPARVAASLLNAVGLPELIVPTLADYEALAIALALDPARLRDLKQKLIAGRAAAPLFDTHAFTRNIEAAYRRMFESHHAGQPPHAFNVT
jgi:protein O-GlcNAc transferase